MTTPASKTSSYPGIEADLKGEEIKTPQRDARFYQREWQFTSQKTNSLVRNLSFLQTKAGQISLYVTFDTQDTLTLREYFLQKGVRLELTKLRDGAWFHAAHGSENTGKLYAVVKESNVFVDGSNKVIESALGMRAKL